LVGGGGAAAAAHSSKVYTPLLSDVVPETNGDFFYEGQGFLKIL